MRASLYTFTSFFSLFLMMVFMTYSAYLIIPMLAGMFTGHFFGQCSCRRSGRWECRDQQTGRVVPKDADGAI